MFSIMIHYFIKWVFSSQNLPCFHTTKSLVLSQTALRDFPAHSSGEP